MNVLNATTFVDFYTNLNATIIKSTLGTAAAAAAAAVATSVTAVTTTSTATSTTTMKPSSLVTTSMEIIADSMTTIAANNNFNYNNNNLNNDLNEFNFNLNLNQNDDKNMNENFDIVQTLANFAAKTLTVNSTTSEFLSTIEGGYSMITNVTYPVSLEHAPKLSKAVLIKVIVLSVMAFVSLLGNIATMWNIYKTRMTRRASRHTWSAIYSLIFHLSIADVLVTGFCLIGEAAWSYTVQWYADEFTCKMVKLFQMFSLYLSTYVLVLVGVDRWIAVKYPMKSLNMAKRCYRLLGGTYVLSFVLSLPQFFIFRVAKGPFIEEFHQCVTHGFYTAEWQEQLYTTFTLFFTFIIPLCILVVTYLSTFRTISGSEKMFQGSKLAVYTNKPSVQTNRQRLIHKAKMKSLRISVVIIVAFLICWTPYNVMMIIFTFLNPDKRFGEELQSGIFFFGMSNSLVNPLIYGAFHLCPLKRKNSKYTHCSLTRDNSQRSPSVMTAVTQVDCNGRQTRTFRQPSYYRTNLQNSHNEQFSLLNRSSPPPRNHLRHTTTTINSVGQPLLMSFNPSSINGYKTTAKDNISSV